MFWLGQFLIMVCELKTIPISILIQQHNFNIWIMDKVENAVK